MEKKNNMQPLPSTLNPCHSSPLGQRVVVVLRISVQAFPYEWLVHVGLPQLADQVRQYDVCGVLGHQPQDEDAVVTEVVEHKLLGQPLVRLSLQLAEQQQVLLDVAHSAVAVESAPDPEKEVSAGKGGHPAEPEPEEDEDLLVKHVDRQHALHGVPLHVVQLADVEVAQRDPGEA